MFNLLKKKKKFKDLELKNQAKIAIYLSKYADGSGDNFQSTEIHQQRVIDWLRKKKF